MSFIKMTQPELDSFVERMQQIEDEESSIQFESKYSKKIIVEDSVKELRYVLNLKTDREDLPCLIKVVSERKESDMYKKLKKSFRNLIADKKG